jgi:hypothetical protein
MQGQARRALRLVSAAAALRETIGAPLSPPEQAKLDRLLEPIRQSLGDAAQTMRADGRAMSLEQAIEHALEEGEVGG